MEDFLPEDFEDVPEPEDDTIEDTIDETGIDPKDIEMVMNQTGASRAKAVRALQESDGDLINAIMAASG
ncbi:ubiquitin-like domain-containing protein [Streptomyces sp. NPDC021608]|uniref:ubiquitin-like domain-containing protein n=1 Tax=Streptomyces sp. NPDC021608 TaxID=3154903 RepID=UPI0033CD9978